MTRKLSLLDKTNRHPHVVNVDEVNSRTEAKGSRFGYIAKRLGTAAGGKSIGCNYFKLAPGRTAFPHHYHQANKETVYGLSGTGAMSISSETVSLRTGDTWRFLWGRSMRTPLQMIAQHLKSISVSSIEGFRKLLIIPIQTN